MVSRTSCLTAALVFAATAAQADAPEVVVSIKPLHSLVAGVMGDVASPHLLVSGADSPHTYAMRPSEARALSKADVVFWIGDGLETFLEKPIESLGSGARAIALIDAPGLTLLDYGNESHEDGHTDRDETDDHHHAGIDPHIWLDPANARAMVDEIVAVLSEADPGNAEAYRSNGATLSQHLGVLETETAEKLAPYRQVPYFTFHDSFRYFDNRFELSGQGSITISPDRQPGAQRLSEIRNEISGFDRVCIFAEPQFPPKLVDVIVEGTAARTGVVDPLGAALQPGPDLYFRLIEANRDAFATCFQETM